LLNANVDLNDPTTVALLAAEAFEAASHPYALYGGLLTAAYGEPRETRDADLAVVDLTADRAREALATTGVRVLIAFENTTFGGLSLSRLTLLGAMRDMGSADTTGATSATGLNTIDLVQPRSQRYAALAVERAVRSTLRDRPLRVLTLEDFILFKMLTTRDRDLEDARAAIRRSKAALDRVLLDDERAALAAELPDVDIERRWAAIQGQL